MAIQYVMGDYASTTRPEVLMDKKHDNIPVELAALKGVRFTSTVETRVFRSIRSPNTLHADRAIRLNPITDYGLIRSRNSVHGDHL